MRARALIVRRGRGWISPRCRRRTRGFPTAQLVGLFCLATGRLVRFAFADWKAHEIPLARQLIAWFQPREIALADRAYCGCGFTALLQRKAVDVVLRPWDSMC